MKYTTSEELKKVFDSFEDASVRREDWGHPEHLIVAYHYARSGDFDLALDRIKSGIFRLLIAFEVDLSKDMPYHETLTVFWLRTVFDFLDSHSEHADLDVCRGLIESFDKNYPLKFYSRECLFSDQARREFVEPDLVSLQKI